MENSSVIGIATCTNCAIRMRVGEKLAHLVGKNVRCPKCNETFTLTVCKPTAVEQAAIESSSEENGTTTRTRRSKKQIRKEHIDSVKEGFRALHGRLGDIANESSSSENNIRTWCVDALRNALGYDDSCIDTEMTALNQRVDIAIKKDNKTFMVIECKRLNIKLSDKVLQQATSYASILGAEWVVLTNGQLWDLYRIQPRTGTTPQIDQLFSVALLDDDGVSDEDAEMLYLLTDRAISSGDTLKYYHYLMSISPRRFLKALKSERVMKALRLQLNQSYKDDVGIDAGLDDDDVLCAIDTATGVLDL